MEMKFYKNVLTLFLVTLLTAGCGKKSITQDQSIPENAQQSLYTVAKTTNINDLIVDFKKEVKALIEELKQKKSLIKLDNFKDKYENLKKQATDNPKISSFLGKEEFLALTKISNIKWNDENSDESQKEKIIDLQKTLKLDQKDQTGVFASISSSKLVEFLQEIIDRDELKSMVNPRTIESETDASKYPFDLGWLMIAAVVMSSLSIGANALLYWLLNQSKNRFRMLEKKVQDNRDDTKKWSAKVEQNIKALSSQQSEIDRKVQQQRQQAKGSSYPEPAQVYGEREQFGYEETFNPSSAPSPSSYVSTERATYPSTPKAYQAPQSPYEVIAQQYNTNPNSIGMSAQGVSETEDSIYRRRRDASIKQVTLQSINNYGYWIITDTEGIDWLTPIAEPKLNPMNFDTFQALFHFNGEPLSGKLQLIKPAKVTQVSTSQWELIDRGEVQFI
jgi:hypothetical protein